MSSSHTPLNGRLIKTGILRLFSPSQTANSKAVERREDFGGLNPQRTSLFHSEETHHADVRLANTRRGDGNSYREKTPSVTPDAPGDKRKGQRNGNPIHIQGYLNGEPQHVTHKECCFKDTARGVRHELI